LSGDLAYSLLALEISLRRAPGRTWGILRSGLPLDRSCDRVRAEFFRLASGPRGCPRTTISHGLTLVAGCRFPSPSVFPCFRLFRVPRRFFRVGFRARAHVSRSGAGGSSLIVSSIRSTVRACVYTFAFSPHAHAGSGRVARQCFGSRGFRAIRKVVFGALAGAGIGEGARSKSHASTGTYRRSAPVYCACPGGVSTVI